jgi:cytochrome c556
VKRLHRPYAAALLIASGFAALAPTVTQAQDTPPVVEYRNGLMNAFRSHLAGITAATSATVPIGHAEYHAVAFERMTQALANAFPEGSGGPGSRALPAIWENRSDFMDKVTAIQMAAARVVTASRTGDAEQIGSAVQAVRATCGACHNPYRGPAN